MRPALPFLLVLCLVGCDGARTYTVITYNIRYAEPQDGPDHWDLRKHALANAVMEQRPSIIGLQEVLLEQLAYLRQAWPGYGYVGNGRDDGHEAGEFAPIFYDTAVFELIEGRTSWLSPTPDRPSRGWDAALNRIVTLAILRDRDTGDSLWVANTHWDHEGREARMESARQIAALLTGPIDRGQRAIVLGDLNASSDEPSLVYLHERMEDACPEALGAQGTFNAFRTEGMFNRRIDHVLLSPGRWQVVSYDVPTPQVHGRQVSDHFPVLVRVRAR